VSARWRRDKRHSKPFKILRTFSRAKEKSGSQIFRIENSRIQKRTYPCRYGASKAYRNKKWKDPEPLIDVLNEKNEIRVVAEFAGFQRENLKINIENQQLILSAEASDRKYYKSLNLPKRVIPDKMHMTCKNGVLEIRLMKAVEEKPIDKVVG
jgi:HSP20 family molecular chaperone IbpA